MIVGWVSKAALFGAACFATESYAQPIQYDLWSKAGQGHYVGELILQPLPDGRHMRLLKPFGFVDSNGRAWPVPKGTIVDGASIPRAFWSIVGGPFEGKYRNASVIHDYYCDVRTRTWEATDRVFYDAMISSGVDDREAKILYSAVVVGGPRWDLQTVSNNILSSHSSIDEAAKELAISSARDVGDQPSDKAIAEEPQAPMLPAREISALDARRIADGIGKSNPTLDQIDRDSRVR